MTQNDDFRKKKTAVEGTELFRVARVWILSTQNMFDNNMECDVTQDDDFHRKKTGLEFYNFSGGQSLDFINIIFFDNNMGRCGAK